MQLDWLRGHSTEHRQRICTTRGVVPVATVRRSDSGVSVGGVMVCGKRNCPMCGPRLYSRNRDDIRQAVAAWEAYGGTTMFGTLTAGHILADPLRASIELTSEAWARVTGDRRFARIRREHGITHWVRVFEEKWSETTGWHCHVHYLLFIEPGFNHSAQTLLLELFKSWRSAVEGAGRRVSFLAQDLHAVTGEDAARVLGDYFTKQLETRSHLPADALALELASRGTKLSESSVTPAEILLLASIGGDPQFAALWREYETATKKRRVIAFSRGLREFAGIGDELDPEAASDEGSQREGAAELMLRGKHVRKALSRPLRQEFVRVVFEQGGAAAVGWLADRGMTGWLPELGELAELEAASPVDGADVQAPEFVGVVPF